MNPATSTDCKNRSSGNASATIYLVSKSADRLSEGRRLASAVVSASDSDISKVLRGIHPDVIELSPPEGKERIGIGSVRDVIRAAQFAPVQSHCKVCLIAASEGLTLEAANALLKILEEPPRGLQFILLAEHPSDLLPTIVSRSRLIRVPIASPSQVADRLREAGYNAPTAEWLAHLPLRDGELDQLLAKQRDVEADLVAANKALSNSDITGLLDGCLGDEPILRRQGFLHLLSRIASQDSELLCVGVRMLAAQTRETLGQFFHECLLTVVDVIRSAHIAATLVDPMIAHLRESLDVHVLHRLTFSLDEAHRAMAVYGPIEGILLSLFLASQGEDHDS